MDWQPIILKALDTLPITVTAVGGAAAVFYKIIKVQIQKELTPLKKGQVVMKKQLDGHTTLLLKSKEAEARAKKAEGIVAGYQRAKRDARYDRKELVKVRKKAIETSRTGPRRRRRTDK